MHAHLRLMMVAITVTLLFAAGGSVAAEQPGARYVVAVSGMH